ncbi:multi-sensor hybrid histidine kinase : Multi-sensor hybrid histidine kinase OS=Koribacter versatilis (strain Ellin345) GN=Acid345_3014 PE=4 SV=1: PAS_9: HisKA: HATPase_c: Response_reg [Gemmata massiliana]|uniref:histidine kinase n=1 Tax=Gemmata massiliana TaxID=1210884 RepID=A0A6P2CQK4_9BACT|nr:PAS domain S-box protein [Gemmata massiliana]VTR91318.1 multi-sensor hybrid histidine kinase : Multi-sensor hybrid histidine kinase OS=Koribacter versatilis (strain Ellin345) GN=Acid345_3014 PE=4 SV=1: PAS_9: HisKA: HATPase_c: Response_reg [Gemmata massiliana]
MTAPPLAVSDARFHRFSRAVAVVVGSVGVIVLIGWAFNVFVLTSLSPDLGVMKANTASGFLASGVALFLSVSGTRLKWVERSAAVLAVVIGFLTLSQYLAALEFGIDQLIAPVGSGYPASPHPGRMAPATATSFILIGLALLILDAPAIRGVAPAHVLALLVASIALIVLAGYIYGVASLHEVWPFSAVSAPAACTLFLLALGVLAARPHRGIVGVIASGTAGGLVIRRQLPLAAVGLFTLGWVRLAGERAGYYDTTFGLALMVVSATALFTALVVWTGLTVHALDLRLRDAEEEARQRAEVLRAVMGSVPDAVITMDDRGIIRSANPAADRTFGYPEGELVGHPMRELVAEPLNTELAEAPSAAKRPTNGIGREVQGRRRDGATFPAELSVAAFQLGGAAHFTVVVRDTTGRKKLEEQFRQAQKMEAVGRLAGGVAHDFNNLLTIINGYCEVLLAARTYTNADRTAAEAIRDAGDRAAALTRQLLTFSRKAITEPQVLDLNEVVTRSVKLLDRLIGADVVLSTAPAQDLAPVRADPSQIEQVVMNLAVNARDAMPKGGRLTIETRNVRLDEGDEETYPDLAPGRYVQLAVSDTGEGMTEEVKARMFEPFFTTKAPGRGTGLGLAMVYGVVQTHGGYVDVYSELGVGTTFKILLPATTETEPRSRPDDRVPVKRGTETVLIAEDEDGVRRLARLTLESQGYRVLEAANGAEAIAVAAAHAGPIHMLVTDVVMPGTNGRKAAEAIRAQRQNLKVLFMSGYTDDAVVRHGIVEATDAFLQKPFTPQSLAHKVRAVLDGSG